MLRLLHKLRPPATTFRPITHPLLSSTTPTRFFQTNGPDVDPVALQMINYALSLTKSQKSPDSYAQSLLVLEQCLSSNVREGDTKGVVLLAMSNLLAERGDVGEAMEKLKRVEDLEGSSLGVRVAAMEGLIGLNLEIGQDPTSSMLADKCLELLNNGGSGSAEFEDLQFRAKANKGLVELLLGDIETAGTCFGAIKEDKGCSGNVMLSHGEFLHATGNFALAKQLYQKAIQGVPKNEGFTESCTLATCNMVPAEVLLGATCAFGQLESHAGNFNDAEEMLTKALTKAEEHFGTYHPKVGVILTCIALMYRRKARLERSSSILIQEGLYRKAIELLKAPALDTEEVKIDRRDIISLARGAYAEILSVQQNRKTEGDRMKIWAEATWGNRRLSLAEALEISEPASKVAVVDTRINRAL